MADIDAARAFNKRTGAVIANVNIRGRSKFLNGATVGPDGIYMTDTGIIFGSKGDVPTRGRTRSFGFEPTAMPSRSSPLPSSRSEQDHLDTREKRFIIVSYLGKGITAGSPGTRTFSCSALGRDNRTACSCCRMGDRGHQLG